jgi:NACalpha-BTF3-like transcription factor
MTLSADSLARKVAQPWDRIWLQFYGADWEDLHGDTEPAPEMTWAQNKINDSDVEYVRAAALAPMREALQALVETYGDYSRAAEFVEAMAKAERLVKGEE